MQTIYPTEWLSRLLWGPLRTRPRPSSPRRTARSRVVSLSLAGRRVSTLCAYAPPAATRVKKSSFAVAVWVPALPQPQPPPPRLQLLPSCHPIHPPSTTSYRAGAHECPSRAALHWRAPPPSPSPAPAPAPPPHRTKPARTRTHLVLLALGGAPGVTINAQNNTGACLFSALPPWACNTKNLKLPNKQNIKANERFKLLAQGGGVLARRWRGRR